ncbi:hypothetical protein [Streptomyces sp. NPDC001165]|uniref:hypothetical protein n=1 Tax=Streptomyces sp. NPDC001165 TaxID=3364546 RepID=UPI0036B62809
MDGALPFAVRAALAMGLVAVPIVAAGRPDLAVYAMRGSFTTTFGRNLPYARRARVLAVVAVAVTACVGCGSALAVWAHPRGVGDWCRRGGGRGRDGPYLCMPPGSACSARCCSRSRSR